MPPFTEEPIMDVIVSRQLELLNIIDNTVYTHENIVELYYLRDIEMGLNPNDQIEWALQKLDNSFRHPSRFELVVFQDSSDILNFYKTCTLEELLFLGY